MPNVALEQEFIAAAITIAQDPSSIANVGLRFPHLVPENELEAKLFSVIFLSWTEIF